MLLARHMLLLFISKKTFTVWQWTTDQYNLLKKKINLFLRQLTTMTELIITALKYENVYALINHGESWQSGETSSKSEWKKNCSNDDRNDRKIFALGECAVPPSQKPTIYTNHPPSNVAQAHDMKALLKKKLRFSLFASALAINGMNLKIKVNNANASNPTAKTYWNRSQQDKLYLGTRWNLSNNSNKNEDDRNDNMSLFLDSMAKIKIIFDSFIEQLVSLII